MARTYLKKQAAASRPFGPVLTALGLAMMSPAVLRAVRFSPDADGGAGAEDGGVKMSISKIRDGMKACSAELDALEASYDKEETDEGKSKFQKQIDAKNLELNKFEFQLKRVEGKATRQNRINTVTRLAELAPGGVNPAGIPAEGKTSEADDKELHKAFEKFCCNERMSDRELDALQPKSKSWDEKSAAKSGVRVPDPFKQYALRKLHGKALPMTSGSDTGNKIVFPEYVSEVEMFEAEEPILWGLVRKLPTRNGELILPYLDQDTGDDDFAGVTFEWTAEGAAPAGSEPKFGQRDFKQYEAKAKTELANRLLSRQTVNLPALITGLFGGKLMNGMERAIISGDGNGKPEGFLKAGNYKSIARVGANAIVYNDCTKVLFGVAPQLRRNGIFHIADDGLEALMELKDTQGRPIFLQSLREGGVDTLLGKKLYSTTRTSLGATGDLMFLDPRRYIATVEDEVVIGKSEHEKFSQGLTVFLAFVCFGGKVTSKRGVAALAA